MWDSVSCNSTFTKVKSEKIIQNAASSKLGSKIPTRHETEENFEDHMLPSWELLENALQTKFLKYEYIKPNSFEENKDVNVEYLLISNDTKELSKKPTSV